MPEIHRDQVVPFELELVALERVRKHDLVRELSGKSRLPERLEEVRCGLPAHVLQDPKGGDGSRIRKALPEDADAERMVAAAMRDVNRH